MNSNYSRRDFLKFAALGLGSMAFKPMINPGDALDTGELIRVTTSSVSVYSEPNDASRILYQRFRDDLVNVYQDVVSRDGPGYNPLWYRVWRGYIHSAHTVKISPRLNPVASYVPEGGQLAEITVPYAPSMRYSKYYGWEPLYRLYNESVHWVMGVESGPDGGQWYRIKDEFFDIDELDYFIPAAQARLIPDEELTPLSPDVPPEKKRIEISIARQTLSAFEYDEVVFESKIASGIPMAIPPEGMIKTDTPTGEYRIQVKMPSKHMGDGNLTSEIEAYELPGVPWVCFFQLEHGVATHGTYWHTNYGTFMSRGCVNMRSEEAKWLFRWTTPVYQIGNIDQKGYGTVVRIG